MNGRDHILHVDLSKETCTRHPVPDNEFSIVIGGRGFNISYLFKHLQTNIDPLSPDNILTITCGMLTGSAISTASRLHLNALSPLTGILGSSNVGGFAGAYLRSCGIFSIIVRGRASRPVYLHISEKKAEIRSADHLWGLDAIETQTRVREQFGEKKVKTLAIGPGGENGVRFACIMSGQDHAAGRTGMGAVMGSKNLKAIAIAKGDAKPFPRRSATARKVLKRYLLEIKNSPDYRIFSKYGGAGYVKWANEKGILGALNYRNRTFAQIDQIDGMRLKEDKVKSRGCSKCPVHCKAVLQFKKGRFKGQTAARPEFESVIALGAKCGLSDLHTIVHLENLCSRLGLDATSAASVIAFAMDLFDRGILIQSDTDGLTLSWGNSEAMETLIRQIAVGEGLGRILSQGVKHAAEIIGKGAEAYAVHVKGLELTAYHPNAMLGAALGYAISSRGGDFNNVYACLEYGWPPERAAEQFGTAKAVDVQSPLGKGALIRRAVLVNIVLDSLGLCKVPVLSIMGRFDLINEAELSAGVTGLPFSPENLFKTGERIAAMERLFNMRHGPDNYEDKLPEMFLKDKGSALTQETLETMLADFYDAMGWDAAGRPTLEKQEELGLINPQRMN